MRVPIAENFYVSLTWAYGLHDVKSIFNNFKHFLLFSTIKKRMRKHAFAVRNTQQAVSLNGKPRRAQGEDKMLE